MWFEKIKQKRAEKKKKKVALNFRKKLTRHIEILEHFVGMRKYYLSLNTSQFKAARMKTTCDFIELHLPYLRETAMKDLSSISEKDKKNLQECLDNIQKVLDEFYKEEKTYEYD